MEQITKRFQTDRKGSSTLFVKGRVVLSKGDAQKIAGALRRKGNLVRVTKTKRKGVVQYDIWVY